MPIGIGRTDLRALIAAHICERDLPLRDFVGGFDGLARNRVRADVLETAKLKGSHLSDLVRGKDVNMPSVTRLLEAMQTHSRPVQPKRLGLIGRDHLKQHFDSLGATKGFKYDRKTFYDDEGLPVVVETAFAIRPDAAAHFTTHYRVELVTDLQNPKRRNRRSD